MKAGLQAISFASFLFIYLFFTILLSPFWKSTGLIFSKFAGLVEVWL